MISKKRGLAVKIKKSDIFKKIIFCLKKEFGEELSSIILFGSYAKGKENMYSDFDVLAVTKTSSGDWRKKDRLAVEVESQLNYPLDLVLLTSDELHRAALNLSPLLLSIFENRYKLLYGPDLIKKEKKNLHTQFKIKKISPFGWEFKKVAA